MKLFIRIAFSICAAALFSTPANADYLYPYSGWWGAGYYGSPVYAAPLYSSYYAPSSASFYGSYSSPSYGCCGNTVSAYSGGCGSCGSCGGGCCTNSCCPSSCDGACSSGCASGSCAGTTPAGSLKPAQDPISEKKAPNYEEDLRSRRYVPETSTPRDRGTEEPVDSPRDRDPLDNFNAPNSGTRGRLDSGTGSGRDSGFFEESTVPPVERLNNKPPMADPLEGKELEPVDPELGNPVDEKTFYDDTAEPGNTTFRGRDAVVARTSSLSEVIAPKRLASRSLPSVHRPVSQSTLADKSVDSKSESPRPLRWISAPLADGHLQL